MQQFRVPVLMYHEVNTAEREKVIREKMQHSFILNPAQFETQIRFLAKNGFHFISPNQLIKAIDENNFKQLPEYPIVITFDDGFSGNYEFVLPVLLQYNATATFFVTVNQIATPLMMTWRQLQELSNSGMSVESHSMNHIFFGELDDREALKELKDSKQSIEQKLGKPVRFISLPNGSYSANLTDLAKQVGYLGGFSSDIGYVKIKTNPFLLNRISISSKLVMNDFVRIVNGDASFLRPRIRRIVRKTAEQLVGESAVNNLYHFVYGVTGKAG